MGHSAKNFKEEVHISIPIIQRSEADAWLKAAKADGGYHKVKIAGPLEQVNFDMNKIHKKGFSLDAITADINKKLRNGYKFNNLTPLLESAPGVSKVDRYEGKRVVDNTNELCSLTVAVGDAPCGTSDWARRLQDSGAAIHTFCYEEMDFLFDAAESYATLADDEVFKYRGIDDISFISNLMSDLLQRTMNGFMRFYLERIDEKLSKCRAKGGAPDDRKGYASLDRNAVWDVYQYTMQEYRNSGDVIKALLSGVKYGSAKTAAALLERGTYRANNTSYFWTHFFERNQRRYGSPDSSYQKYLAGWRDFEASLSGGEVIRMNLELKGSEYYTAGKTNILNKIIYMVGEKTI